MSGLDFEDSGSHEEFVRISGRVKWFDTGKGYGFIVPDDPGQTGLKDVLLHVTSLRNCGRETALEGAVIVCDVVKRPKGWQVSEVVDLDETAASAPLERPKRAFGDGGLGLALGVRVLTAGTVVESARRDAGDGLGASTKSAKSN